MADMNCESKCTKATCTCGFFDPPGSAPRTVAQQVADVASRVAQRMSVGYVVQENARRGVSPAATLRELSEAMVRAGAGIDGAARQLEEALRRPANMGTRVTQTVSINMSAERDPEADSRLIAAIREALEPVPETVNMDAPMRRRRT